MLAGAPAIASQNTASAVNVSFRFQLLLETGKMGSPDRRKSDSFWCPIRRGFWNALRRHNLPAISEADPLTLNNAGATPPLVWSIHTARVTVPLNRPYLGEASKTSAGALVNHPASKTLRAKLARAHAIAGPPIAGQPERKVQTVENTVVKRPRAGVAW